MLLIDDDVSVIHTFGQILRFKGYEVAMALTAEAGLRELEGFHPHAVLLDLRMPQNDGLIFLRRMRADPARSQIPVAVVTGDYFIDHAIASELKDLGVVMYLQAVVDRRPGRRRRATSS